MKRSPPTSDMIQSNQWFCTIPTDKPISHICAAQGQKSHHAVLFVHFLEHTSISGFTLDVGINPDKSYISNYCKQVPHNLCTYAKTTHLPKDPVALFPSLQLYVSKIDESALQSEYELQGEYLTIM